MESISRRSFLKLAGTATVAATGTAMFSGCGVQLVPFHLTVSQYGNPLVSDGKTETLDVFAPEFLLTSGAMASLIDWLMDNVVRPEFKRRYKDCTDVQVTSDAASSSKVVRNADGSYSMVLTVRVIMANNGKDDNKDENPDGDNKDDNTGKDDTDKEPEDETIVGDIYFYEWNAYCADHLTPAAYAFIGARMSLQHLDVEGYLNYASEHAFLGAKIRATPNYPYPTPAFIDYTKSSPRLNIFFEFVDVN